LKPTNAWKNNTDSDFRQNHSDLTSERKDQQNQFSNFCSSIYYQLLENLERKSLIPESRSDPKGEVGSWNAVLGFRGKYDWNGNTCM